MRCIALRIALRIACELHGHLHGQLHDQLQGYLPWKLDVKRTHDLCTCTSSNTLHISVATPPRHACCSTFKACVLQQVQYICLAMQRICHVCCSSSNTYVLQHLQDMCCFIKTDACSTIRVTCVCARSAIGESKACTSLASRRASAAIVRNWRVRTISTRF